MNSPYITTPLDDLVDSMDGALSPAVIRKLRERLQQGEYACEWNAHRRPWAMYRLLRRINHEEGTLLACAIARAVMPLARVEQDKIERMLCAAEDHARGRADVATIARLKLATQQITSEKASEDECAARLTALHAAAASLEKKNSNVGSVVTTALQAFCRERGWVSQYQAYQTVCDLIRSIVSPAMLDRLIGQELDQHASRQIDDVVLHAPFMTTDQMKSAWGWVIYFIQDERNGWIKIGSASNLYERYTQLRRGACRSEKATHKGTAHLRVLAVVRSQFLVDGFEQEDDRSTTTRTEKMLHKRYGQHRARPDDVNNEWFKPAPPLLRFVKFLQAMFPGGKLPRPHEPERHDVTMMLSTVRQLNLTTVPSDADSFNEFMAITGDLQRRKYAGATHAEITAAQRLFQESPRYAVATKGPQRLP